MAFVSLTGAVRASRIRSAVNDIDTDGPGDLNYTTQISIGTARDKLHTLQGRTNAPSSGQVSFSQFRGSQAISVTITVKGETPDPAYYNEINDGSIKVSIVSSKVSTSVSTTLSGNGTKSGTNVQWTGLNSGNYTVTVKDNNTGFQTSTVISLGLSTGTSYKTINIA